MTTIENCIISQSNAIVRKFWVSESSDPLYNVYGGYHTGLDIECTDVHSMCDGTVIQVGRDASGYTVTVQYNATNCFQYKGLADVKIVRHQKVSTGTLLGFVDKYVHFEYLTDAESEWPVRIGQRTYYKHNPESVVNGYQEILEYRTYTGNVGSAQYPEVPPELLNQFPQLTPTMLYEHTNNRGED